jgi:hypothetical protein
LLYLFSYFVFVCVKKHEFSDACVVASKGLGSVGSLVGQIGWENRLDQYLCDSCLLYFLV